METYANLIHPAVDTARSTVLANVVMNCPVELRSLLREVSFVFGFKLINYGPKPGDSEMVESVNFRKTFYLAYPNGLPAGHINLQNDQNDSEGLRYCFYSPYRPKAKGRNDVDRCTYHSKKIVTLIRAMQKSNLPDENSLFVGNHLSCMRQAMNVARQSMGGGLSYAHSLTTEDVYALILKLKNQSRDGIGPIDDVVIDDTLKDFDETHSKQAAWSEACDRMFYAPMYAIGTDAVGDKIVAKIRVKKTPNDAHVKHAYSTPEVEVIAGPRRITDLGQYPEIASYMTMIKASYEEKGKRMIGGVPIIDHHDPDLGVTFYYPGSPTMYHYAWTFIHEAINEE